MVVTLESLPAICTPGEVSAVTGVPLGTLAYWRHSGTGPAYLKLGRLVRYRREDVASWLDASMRPTQA